MDSDRKSAVSSFYGGRKSSLDPLTADFSTLPTQNYTNRAPEERLRHDDASSFYGPERPSRGSIDLLSTDRTSSAGYNRRSFFHAGREEPLKGGRDEEENSAHGPGGGWDVYADFNNAGPRYSSAFGQPDQG